MSVPGSAIGGDLSAWKMELLTSERAHSVMRQGKSPVDNAASRSVSLGVTERSSALRKALREPTVRCRASPEGQSLSRRIA